MALVEPLIGHLLSKYKETVLEGLSKIRHAVQANDEQGAALATAITQQEEAMQAIRATLLKPDFFAATVQTLTAVLTHLTERGGRVALVREVLRGDCVALFRRTLATLTDTSLSHVIAALQFLTAAVKDAPLLVLARLRGPADSHTDSGIATSAGPRRADVPLHLSAFRLQLTYGQRRVRLVRLGFLVQLITSPMNNAVAETICSHGVLTHLLEDAAELLREGTSAGVACSMEALRVVREHFVQSRDITSEQKRRVLLAQRNIFRLLVRALEFDPVADHAAGILYAVIDETIESPADYASTRVESLEDHGMPNYLLFFLLRQLRPKANERMAGLVLHVLQRAPDLIRPYFIRVSGHLAEEGSTHGVAPTTARVAVINLMTRAFLSPIPHHLTAGQAQLEPAAAKTSTFYTMCPRDVADEVCPAWVAEYVHRLINGSTNLLLLALAMQMTQAALMRAKRVLPLVQAAQRAAEMRKKAAGGVGCEFSSSNGNEEDGAKEVQSAESITFSDADLAALHGNDDAAAEVWDTYNAQVRHHLLAALPSREEFWHRMTQQLHHILTSTMSTPNDAVLTKVHVVTQRMLLLMKNYVDVFDVRAPWLSAVPNFLPNLSQMLTAGPTSTTAGTHSRQEKHTDKGMLSSQHPITTALQQHNDILRLWPAASVSMLCELLVASHQRRVPMVKLHHVNMSQAQGISEWPLLLSVLLWVTHHHSKPQLAAPEERAAGWAAQLLLWTVHSVTIHSTCTLAEAHLWLSALTPNTVPVLLHVLNHLLMRSLSKAADRVTHELREANFGVLMAAAQHFIERTKEKESQKGAAATTDDASGTTTTVTGSRGGRGVQAKERDRKTGNADGTGGNLWGTHLHAALAEFEVVVQHVQQQWPQRDTVLHEASARLQQDTSAYRVTQQQCIDVLVLADRQRGFVKTTNHAVPSAVQQLRTFVVTLHSPVLPLPEEETAMTLLTQLHAVRGTPSAEADGAADDVQRICTALGVTGTVHAKDAKPSREGPRWYAMSSVCWHVAGRLLALLRHQERKHTEDNASETTRAAALGLVRAVLVQRAEVEAVLGASNNAHDGSTTGLLVLLLVCVRVLLSPTVAHNEEVEMLSQSEGDALGALCLSNYMGGLSVHDRLCYAVCLSLHYLLHAPTHAGEAAVAKAVKLDDEEKATVHGSSPHHRGRRPDKTQHDKHCSFISEGGDDVRQRFVCHGATVPQALVQRRFLLAGHTPSAFRTAEVEMLSWHLDTLTEEDMTRMALCVSSRLHNGLLHRRSNNSSNASSNSEESSCSVVDAAEDVLCGVYPELYGMHDVDVTNLDRLTSSDVLDMRYIVPLLHRVAALPPACLGHLPTGRVIPLLLKGLTSIDAQLRAAAATTLATLYIPKGTLRIVVSVARLKLCQLAASATAAHPLPPTPLPKQSGAAMEDTVVPRLPTPLAVFLMTAIRPLGRYEDALHHHLIHHLLHIDTALTVAIPFVQWTNTPPLTAISVPLMLEKQAALQQRAYRLGSSGGSNITQASAADVAQELRKGIPPQLEFMLRLLRHACEVPQDGAALLESDSVNGLMLLCDLLTASDTQRATYMCCLLDLCTRSAALTRLFARQGNALMWTVSFLWALCKEYGVDAPYPYSGLTFTNTLRLLRVLCIGTLHTTALSDTACISAPSVEQLAESLRLLRAWVVEAHVTARDVLDAFDEVIAWCERALRSRDVATAADDCGKIGESTTGSSSSHVAPVQSATKPGKRNRETTSTAALAGRPATSLKRVKAEGVV
ncbi:hypothetical protein ABB37_05601 [Leptomonas pyrrhocoris]|uniref:URB1 N-terminal domain-containing protein n=1 Tax=Leptomonas pyrrhocoris TaxID=157538 RepID=A0A0N0DUM0_LEPPY|nr:hypothetical protein ABB37_05601 [Leptomonas pyrrhocoris]KPA79072.1 hypothetical protein ABB37_05601 [Leptomonas pyrrhocoris]|eukprot:XP_015657511.1 hypothetical protein ABB37_05601 [Leptomonas pyrrhocoris]